MVNNYNETKSRPLLHGSEQLVSNSCVLFVKLGKQVRFHVLNIHLISFSLVTPSHVIHICLVTVKTFH